MNEKLEIFLIIEFSFTRKEVCHSIKFNQNPNMELNDIKQNN